MAVVLAMAGIMMRRIIRSGRPHFASFIPDRRRGGIGGGVGVAPWYGVPVAEATRHLQIFQTAIPITNQLTALGRT